MKKQDVYQIGIIFERVNGKIWGQIKPVRFQSTVFGGEKVNRKIKTITFVSNQ